MGVRTASLGTARTRYTLMLYMREASCGPEWGSKQEGGDWTSSEVSIAGLTNWWHRTWESGWRLGQLAAELADDEHLLGVRKDAAEDAEGDAWPGRE